MSDPRPLPTPGALPVEAEGSWYGEGLKFTCQSGCTACCTGSGGYVWITNEEAAAIANHLGIDRAAFKRDYCDRFGSRWSIKEQSKSGDCHFLIAGKGCSIYSVRPTQCRTFPFWDECIASEAAWAETASSCPGCNQGELHAREKIEASAARSSGRRTMLERLFARLREIYREADLAFADAGEGDRPFDHRCDLPRRLEPRQVTNLEVALLTECQEWDSADLLDHETAGTLDHAACPFYNRGRCRAPAEQPLSCRIASDARGCVSAEQGRILKRFTAEIARLELLFGINLTSGELRQMLARQAAHPQGADPLTGRRG